MAKQLIILLFLLMPLCVQAQDVDCCREAAPVLACAELNQADHATVFSLDPDNPGALVKTIYGNGSECGCSSPYESCGLSEGKTSRQQRISGLQAGE